MKEKPSDGVRLDKWLWAARFYKTRALAREMVDGGKVHYNGQRSKPSKMVELNATLTLRQGNDEKTVVIKAITEQRRPATEATQLYEETAESIEKREKTALARKMNRIRNLETDSGKPQLPAAGENPVGRTAGCHQPADRHAKIRW
ncbi:MAG: ribosome-associated heat shock protein Hsp15 [Enterobacter mori]|nr:ribosome-associated heat shock protein Hsp15 [Enterobacter mori]